MDLKAAVEELKRRFEQHITEKGYGAHMDRHAKDHKDVDGTLDRIPTGVGGAAPSTASYVTIAAEAGLSSERRVAAGNAIGLTDAGANSTLTIALSIAGQVIGDIIYHTGAVWDRLAGNTTVTKKFLTQTGDGAASAAPGWGTIADGDVPATHSGSPHHARQHGLGTAADHTGITDYTVSLGLDRLSVDDANYYLDTVAGNPNIIFDAGPDCIWYDRTNNLHTFTVGNTAYAQIGAAGLKVDHILEVSGGHGVNVSGIDIGGGLVDGKDVSDLTTNAEADAIADALIATHTADADAHHALYTDAAAIAAVEAEATLDLTGAVTIAAAKTLGTDHVVEKTLNHGVDVDGLLIKDGGIPGSLAIGVNDTAETILLIYGADAGHFAGGRIELYPSADYDAVIDNWNVMPWEDDFWIERNGVGNPDICIKNDGHVEIQNGALEVDHINEYTAGGGGHGVNVDGVLIKDNLIDAAYIGYTPSVLTDWDGDADPGDLDDALNQLAERIDDVEGGAGHTRLHAMTDVLDHVAGYWKVFYSEGDGTVHELALGTDGQVLTSTGAATAPAFEDAAGGGGGAADAAFLF